MSWSQAGDPPWRRCLQPSGFDGQIDDERSRVGRNHLQARQYSGRLTPEKHRPGRF